MLAGMIVGLAVAAVLYLQGADRMGQDFDWLNQEPSVPAATPAPAAPDSAAPERSRFQFYELLPRDEVRIPQPPAPAAAIPRTPAPATEAPTARTPEPPARPATRILLQTGSFREHSQADEMKARLAMMGLQADIRQVQVGGQTFHRVYLGPFENEAQADRWAERLRRENIEVLRLPVSG
jgi:cell division protein FtsN